MTMKSFRGRIDEQGWQRTDTSTLPNVRALPPALAFALIFTLGQI
jgi:hypothetical protein